MSDVAQISPHARKYPVAAMVKAREHKAAGWSHRKIAEMIASEFGTEVPEESTVRAWVCPKAAERANRAAANRRAKRRRERIDRRIRAAHAEGMPPQWISVMARLCWGEGLSASGVRYRLQHMDSEARRVA